MIVLIMRLITFSNVGENNSEKFNTIPIAQITKNGTNLS